MKVFKNLMMVIIDVTLAILLIITIPIKSFTCLSFNVKDRQVTNIGVLFSNASDPILVKLREEFKEIEKENGGKVRFIFEDGKNNESTQKAALDSLLQKKIQLLIIWIDQYKDYMMEKAISKVSQKNIPLVTLGNFPQEISKYSKSSNKVAFINAPQELTSNLEGEILADLWHKNQKSIDINNDNVLQYIMIKGNADNKGAIDRTKYSIQSINKAGIRTELLSEINADWKRELSEIAIYNLFLKFTNRIEAIIANNDEMAIGAVEALQKYGYNKGDTSKFIPVVGIDGLADAKALIDKGYMTGTVIQDTKAMAQAFYSVGMNLVNGLSPIQNTDYKYEDGFVIVNIPVSKYTMK